MAVRALRGGEKLQAALRDLAAKARQGATLRVGFLEGSTYPDGTPTAEIALFNEFGARTTPPHPFMRMMVAQNEDGWGKLLGAALKATDFDGRKALEMVGLRLESQMQDSIKALTDPPLKPATIEAKGFDTPLIDTGHMLRSVASEVVDAPTVSAWSRALRAIRRRLGGGRS